VSKPQAVLELRHLRYFVAVAEELNFTRAAARLGTAQPPLSQQIIQLEAHVGTALLVRNKRRVRLTPAGRVYFREARDILSRTCRAAELAASAAGGRSHELSIGMMPAAETTILPKLLPLLASRMPTLRVAMHSLGSYDDQVGSLRSHATDVAFLWGPVDEVDLVSDPLYEEHFVAVLPAAHPMTRKRRVGLHDLEDIPCVVPSGRTSPSLRHAVADLYERVHARLRPTRDADNVLGHLNMVRAGLGFALLPSYVAELAPPGVAIRELDWSPPPTIPVVLAYLKDVDLPVLGPFKRVLREALRSLRPARRHRR
jgi:LysR family hca operon transcriptional activator